MTPAALALAGTALTATLLMPSPATASPGPGASTSTPSCPASTVGLLLSGGVDVSSATFDTTYSTAHASFDLRTGDIAISQDVANGASRTHLMARDAYDVQGVPPGTPVAVTAALDVNASASNGGCGFPCGGWFYVFVRNGDAVAADSVAEPDTHYVPATATLVETLELPLTIVAGVPETIEFELYNLVFVGGNGGGQGTGRIHFLNVPPEVTIVSCQGFGQLPTAAHPRSWGALKMTYR